MNATQYLRNVGKSMGYIAIDSFKHMAPNTHALFENAKDFSSDLYQTINDFKGKAAGSGADSLKGTIKSTATDTWKNARDDFLSGKWYNKERKDAADNEMLKNMGFDFDFDLDLDDFGDFADESDKAVADQSAKETEAVIGTINGSVASAANTVASITAKSTDYLASVQNNNTAALYNLNTQGFNNVNIGMNAINANLGALVSLAEPLTSHMQNSAVFYAKSTEYQEKSLKLLEQLVANTTPAKPKKTSGKVSFEDYLSDSGVDIARLFGDMKGNASKTIKEYQELLALFGGGKGLTGDLTSSPISFLISSLLIPQMMGKKRVGKIKSIDDYIKTLGFQALNKGSRKFNNSGIGSLLGFLGIELPELKTIGKIDTGKYNKGQMPWNGMAQKALMEVIPYYLSKMTAIMEGSGQIEVFDYNKGAFTTRGKLKADFYKERYRGAKSAGNTLFNLAGRDKSYNMTDEEINAFSTLLILKGGRDYDKLFSPIRDERDAYLKSHPEINSYLNGRPALKKFIMQYSDSSARKGAVTKYDMGNYAREIGDAISSNNRFMTRAQDEGTYNMLFNGSTGIRGGSGFFGMDKDGYSAIDYLRGIFINTAATTANTNKKGKGAPAVLEPPKSLKSGGSGASATSAIKSLVKNSKDVVTGKTDEEEAEGFLGSLKSTLHDIMFSDGGLLGWITNEQTGVKASFKKVGNAFKNFYFGDQSVENMYNGGFVSRTGLAALSEGEIVIPAQFNPYYKKAIKRNVQKARENRAISRFFGGYADGTVSVGDEDVPEKQRLKVQKGSFLDKAGTNIKDGFSYFGALLGNLFAESVGIDGDKDSFDKQREKVANIIGNATANIKGTLNEHGGSMLVGGMIGGGVSLLTGAAINPILGAALGSATALAMSSAKVRDFLFGTDEKEGITGKYGKDIRRFVEQQLPTTLMSGATGGAAGLLLGHPVVGMFLGAGAGFLSQSKKAQNFLFGEMVDVKDDEGNVTQVQVGGMLPNHLKDTLQKAIPGMSAGAITGVIATALGGPFGLVGNMLIGAGVGAVTTSEKFKNWFLGEEVDGKRQGGFVGELRTRVLDPIREIFFNMSDKIRQDIRDLSIKLFDYLKRTIVKISEGPVGKVVKGGVGLVGKGVKKGLNALNIDISNMKPIDLRGVANRVRGGNLMGGYGVRNKNGRYLTASERLDEFDSLTGFDSSDLLNSFGYASTNMLANMDKYQLNALNKQLAKATSAADLKEFGFEGTLTDSQLRRLRESARVESKARNAKSPVENIAIAVENIKETLSDIRKYGINPKFTADKTTAEGAKSEQEQKQRFLIEQKNAEIQESMMKSMNYAFGTDEEGNPLPDKSEKKKQSILNSLFGPDSIIGKASSFIVKAGKWISAIGLGSIILAAMGIFDELAYKILGDHGLGDAITGGFSVTGGTGGGGVTDENGDVVDLGDVDKVVDYSNPESIKNAYEHIKDYNYKRTDTYSLSERAKEGLLRGTIRSMPKLVGKAAQALAVGWDKVYSAMLKIFNIPTVKSFLGLGDDSVKVAAKNVTNGIINEDTVAKLSSKELSEIIQNVTVVINVVFAVVDFTAGYQDAEVTLGVSEPTTGQRVLSGMLRALKNLIPFIGPIIPDKLVIDVFVKVFGDDLSPDFIAQREAAEEELANYNAEHGTELTWSQYQKGVLDNKTWTEKIWEGTKTRVGRTIETAQVFGKDAAQNGLGSALGNYFGGGFERAWEKTKASDGNFASKAMGFQANIIDEIMPGIIGDIYSSAIRCYECALKGDIAGIADCNLEVFEGSDDPITGMMSHFINPILLTSKIAAYPIGFVAKFVKDIIDTFTGTNKGMDDMPKDILTTWAMVNAHAAKGDLIELWKMKVEGNTGIPLVDGIQAVLMNVSRVGYTPWAAVVFAIRKVVEGIINVGKGIGTAAVWTYNVSVDMNPYVMNGDIEGLWKADFTTETDNGLLNGLQTVVTSIYKVMMTPSTAISWVGHKIVDFISNTVTGIKTGFEWLNTQGNIGKDLIQNEDNGDVALEKLFDIPDPGDDVAFSGLFKTAAITTRILGIGFEVAKGAFRALKDIIAESDFGQTVTAIKTDLKDAATKTFTGDALGLTYMTTSNSAGGFWHNLSEGVLQSAKTIMGPIAVVTTGVKLLVNGVKDNIEPAKATFSSIGDDVEAMWNLAKSGEVYDVLGYESTANQDGEHPFWGTLGIVVDGVMRVPMTVIGLATWAGKKVADSVKTIIDTMPTLVNAAKDQIEYGSSIFEDGWSVDDISSIFTSNLDWNTNDPFEKMYNITTGIYRLMGAPVGLLKYGAKKTGEAVKKTVDTVKTLIEAAKTQVSKGTEIFSDGWNSDTLTTFLSDGINVNTTNPLELMFNGLTLMTRAIGAPMGLLKYAGKTIGDTITEKVEQIKTDADSYKTGMDSIKEVMKDSSKKFTDVQDVEDPTFVGPLSGVMKIGFGLGKILATAFKCVTGFIDEIKSQFSFQSLWNNLKSIANYKAGGNSGIGAGASGFISQRDGRYAGKSLGGYSVGEMGCGPAAASMVLGNSMSSNINLARKYQTAGGTDLAYFADAFARNGRTPIYYNLGGGASGTDMVRDIASGKPVVLMGRDPYNTSKANSPFGPNNHYVVARGFRNGGVVIDDPEASAGGMVYDPSILANVTAAVGAGSSGLFRRKRRLLGIGGGAANVSTTTDQIWSFFKGKGYSDGAVAGILANIQCESGFRTTAVGDSGHAYGLCQWHDLKNSSSGRYASMLALAKSMGRQVSDLTVQLSHIHNEIGQAGAGYPSTGDPYTAGYNFCVNFERPADSANKGKQRGNIAKEFYNHYKGQKGSYSDTTGAALGETGSALSSALSGANNKTLFQKLMGFTSSLASAGNVFSKFNIGNIFSSAISGNTSSFTGFKSAGLSARTSGTATANWPNGQPVDYMRSVMGRLQYSNSNRDPDKGGGDCSSTVAWALTKAGMPVTTDSRWQYVNKDGSTPSWQNVLWYNGGKRLSGPIPVQLQPNDVIFYSHGGSNYPDHVDHVEMYNGNNQIIGHGGGIGTKVRSVSTMQDQIIKIVRPKGVGASGSGLGDLAIKPKKVSTITKSGRVYNLSDYKRVATSAGASNIGSGIDKSTALILKTMITLIESIVKNTDDISAIYKLLSAYCANNSDTKSAEILSKLMEDRNEDNSRIEDNLADLKATVDSILAS